MKRKEKYKDLFAEDCEVVEIYRNKAVVKISETKNLITKKIGDIKKGDRVNLFKLKTLTRFTEVFIYLSPLYYLFLGFMFGFLFYNHNYHYLLMLGMSILGFVQLFVLRHITNKLPSSYYVSVKNKKEKV